MSYDIRIMKGDDPYDGPVEALSVKALIEAVNSYAPFAERGVTWSNERWLEYGPWQGLVMHLEEYEPSEAELRGDEEEGIGVADSCNMHISYGSKSDLAACMALAVHIAEATGAKAWDLQLDRPLEQSDFPAGVGRWQRIRTWLASALKGKNRWPVG